MKRAASVVFALFRAFCATLLFFYIVTELPISTWALPFVVIGVGDVALMYARFLWNLWR